MSQLWSIFKNLFPTLSNREIPQTVDALTTVEPTTYVPPTNLRTDEPIIIANRNGDRLEDVIRAVMNFNKSQTVEKVLTSAPIKPDEPMFSLSSTEQEYYGSNNNVTSTMSMESSSFQETSTISTITSTVTDVVQATIGNNSTATEESTMASSTMVADVIKPTSTVITDAIQRAIQNISTTTTQAITEAETFTTATRLELEQTTNCTYPVTASTTTETIGHTLSEVEDLIGSILTSTELPKTEAEMNIKISNVTSAFTDGVEYTVEGILASTEEPLITTESHYTLLSTNGTSTTTEAVTEAIQRVIEDSLTSPKELLTITETTTPKIWYVTPVSNADIAKNVTTAFENITSNISSTTMSTPVTTVFDVTNDNDLYDTFREDQWLFYLIIGVIVAMLIPMILFVCRCFNKKTKKDYLG